MFPGDLTPRLATLFGDDVALVDAKSGHEVSYRALHARVERAATALAALGVGRGDRVALLAKNRLEFIDVLFACARLGALFVPLNWRLKEPELAFLLDDSEPKALLFGPDFDWIAGRLCADRAGLTPVRFDPEVPPAGDDDRSPVDAKVWPFLLEETARSPAPAQAPVTLEDPWIILYTSGTTGHPKGALLPFRQVAFNALNTQVALDLGRTDSTVTYTPFFHTGALHVLTTPLLLKGGTVVVTEGFDPDEVLGFVEAGRCSILFGVPTTFEMLSGASRFADADFSTVRLALCGGAPCPLSLIERYTGRGVVFKQGYGLTEVGPNVLNLNEADVVNKAGSAGQPNLTIVARVVDGELCLSGPCVCLGYWRRPDATAAAFTEDGFFKTGDLVEVDDDGFFKIVDRKKDMFISGGENVYPAEIERVLCDHPAVRLAAVVGVADTRWGEVGRAYLELRDGAHAPDGDALKTWAKERLAGYKVPKQWVVLPELPKNASGKVQKHRIDTSVNVEVTQ